MLLSFKLVTVSMAEQIMCLTCVWEVWNSNLGQAKSFRALQTFCQCFNFYASTCVALTLGWQMGILQTRWMLWHYMVSIMKGLF